MTEKEGFDNDKYEKDSAKLFTDVVKRRAKSLDDAGKGALMDILERIRDAEIIAKTKYKQTDSLVIKAARVREAFYTDIAPTQIERCKEILKHLDRSTKFYLAGAIEHAPDLGKGWRNDMEAWLLKHNIEAVNPLNGESDIFEKHGFTDQRDAKEAKETDYKRYMQLMSEIAEKDYDHIDNCDGIIVYYDDYVRQGAGTQGEISVCKYLNYKEGPTTKPVYIINTLGSKMPGWIYGCATRIYFSMDEFKSKFLKDIL